MAEKIEDLTISDTISQVDPNIELIPSIYSEIQKIEGTDLGEIENKDANKTYNASTDSLEALRDKLNALETKVDALNKTLTPVTHKSDFQWNNTTVVVNYSGSGVFHYASCAGNGGQELYLFIEIDGITYLETTTSSATAITTSTNYNGSSSLGFVGNTNYIGEGNNTYYVDNLNLPFASSLKVYMRNKGTGARVNKVLYSKYV